jgi:hypothetical protein
MFVFVFSRKFHKIVFAYKNSENCRKNFSFGENENFCETEFRENLLIFAYFFRENEKLLFGSTLATTESQNRKRLPDQGSPSLTLMDRVN